MLTGPCSVAPLTKLGFTGILVDIMFLLLLLKIYCRYSLESLVAVLTCTDNQCFEQK